MPAQALTQAAMRSAYSALLQADGVPAPHGVGELGEAAVFFGHDEALTHLRSSL